MKIVSLMIAAVLSFSSVAAFTHSDDTLTQRDAKTGERHCH